MVTESAAPFVPLPRWGQGCVAMEGTAMTVDTSSASADVGRAVMQGPHSGWSYFDEHLDGARFHRLGEIVAAPAFDGEAAETAAAELEALAQSHGYGVADSHFADMARGSLGSEEREAQLEASGAYLDDPTEGDYFTEVRSSERALLAASATDEARSFLGGRDHPASWDGAFGSLHDRMERAFHAGVGMRRETDPDMDGPRSPNP
jgi:hypothetical protein